MKKIRNLGKSGRFTLIELLVVIAIISILASMLLPALTGVRDMARQSLCATQFKQHHAGYLLYANDNTGYICSTLPRYYPDGSVWSWTSGRDELWPYIKTQEDVWGFSPREDKVFQCPMVYPEGRYWWAGADWNSMMQSAVLGSRTSAYGGDPKYDPDWIGGQSFRKPWKWNNVKHPSITVHEQDSDSSSMFFCLTATDIEHCFRHRSKINLLFADSHVSTPDYQLGYDKCHNNEWLWNALSPGSYWLP